MPERAAIYLRVSTAGQGEKDRYGLPVQEAQCRDFCARQGWDVVAVYTDVCSGSVPFSEREQGRRLVEDAEAGRFQRVVTLCIDRLARDVEAA